MGKRKHITVAAAVVLIIVSAGLVYGLHALKPKIKKRSPGHSVPIVEAVKISPGSEEIYIEVSGEVIPAREAFIYTEVEGKIASLNKEMIPGGIVDRGDMLVRIAPKEYRLQVEERKAAVAAAKSKMEIEKGQQIIARQEWVIFEKENHAIEADKRLVLREPQLRSAESELEAARSRLALAELALEKTNIRAPFNAMVMEENAEAGQFVGRQTKVALLAGTDNFWVQASLPPEYLDRITFPGRGRKGSRVKVITGAGNRRETMRIGAVHKLLGDLDPKGRMARILIQIDDPLNLSGKKGMGKVLLGSFVKLEIAAGTLDNVYAVPRKVVADGDRLLILKKDGTLDICKADVKWRRENELLLTAPINEGERLIVSRLQNPLPGMKLRTTDEKPENKGAPKSDEEKKEARE